MINEQFNGPFYARLSRMDCTLYNSTVRVRTRSKVYNTQNSSRYTARQMRVLGGRYAEQILHEAEEVGAVVAGEQLQRGAQVLVADGEQTVARQRQQ